MNEQDIRVLLLNATAMGISMAQVEMVLKISLLVVSIGFYTKKELKKGLKNEVRSIKI
jgi:hypothetical protein